MIYIILATILYSVGILFGVAASRNPNTNLAAAVTNLLSALLPIAVAIPLISKKLVVNQRLGITYAAFAGVCIALFAMSINKAYSVNKVGIVAPIVFGGAIFLSTLASYFVFKEKVGLLQFAGLVLLALGFGVIIYARATGK